LFFLSFLLAVDTLPLAKSPSDTKGKERKSNDLLENASSSWSTGTDEAQSLSKNLQNLKLEKDPQHIKTKNLIQNHNISRKMDAYRLCCTGAGIVSDTVRVSYRIRCGYRIGYGTGIISDTVRVRRYGNF
jgi:hypothetical protein